MSLYIIVWFILGIAGYHIVETLSRKYDEQEEPEYAWAILMGPVLFLAALMACVILALKEETV